MTPLSRNPFYSPILPSGKAFFVPTVTFLEDVTSGVPATVQPASEPPADERSQPIRPMPDSSDRKSVV